MHLLYLSVSKTNFWNLCLSVSAENTTCTGRLLQTCKGIKSFLDLLSFQQICHRHFVSWREGKRGRGQRIEKGAKLEMKEYYFKQFSADNSQSGTTNSGGFDTKANSQIWSVTSGSDLRTWWLLERYLKTGWYEMHTHKHAQSGGLDFIHKTTSVKLGTTRHISQGHCEVYKTPA